MPTSASPQEVLERLLHGISDQRWLELHELYAEDAVVEYPFALPAPTRLQGRDAIQRYFAAVARTPLRFLAREVVVLVRCLQHPGLHSPRRPDHCVPRLSQPPGAGRGDRQAARTAHGTHGGGPAGR
jgi:hypothetical protein